MNTFDNIETPFAAHLTRGPAPRWARKELEAALTPKKAATTPKACTTWHACSRLTVLQGDRFIANRTLMNVEACQFNLAAEAGEQEEMMSSPKAEYQRSVKSLLMNESGSKILSFKGKAPVSQDELHEMRVVYSQNKTEAVCKKTVRHIPQTSDRVLDAPELRPDYYLNLIDWSSQNMVSVALGDVCDAKLHAHPAHGAADGLPVECRQRRDQRAVPQRVG